MSEGTPAPAVGEGTATPAIPPVTPPVVAAPVVPAPAPSAPATPPGDPAWLPARLQQAKEAATREAYKALGFDKPEDAKAGFDELKKRRDAELTESQRILKENSELKTKATRAEELESAVKVYADAALAPLTDAQRNAVAAIAGTDPSRVLKTIESMRIAGMLAPPTLAVVPPVTPPPAVTPPVTPPVLPAATPTATTAPPPAAPPVAPPGGESHLATFERLEKQNPALAAQYKLSNYAAIAAERKARV